MDISFCSQANTLLEQAAQLQQQAGQGDVAAQEKLAEFEEQRAALAKQADQKRAQAYLQTLKVYDVKLRQEVTEFLAKAEELLLRR